MDFYKYDLNPEYFEIDGSNLFMGNLFSTSTEYILINPNLTGPADILSESSKNSMKVTSSSDFSALASTYLDTNWTSNSWTPASFYSQLNTWLINNITNSYLSPFTTCDVVIMQGNVNGSNYTLAFCYPGDIGGYVINPDILSISGGRSHSAILNYANNRVYSFGNNDWGQLGDGTTTSSSIPVSVLGGRSFSVITSGSLSSAGLEASTGLAWTWGCNAAGGIYGTLGDGTTSNKSSPVSVLGGRSFIQISGGKGSSGAADYGGCYLGLVGSNGNAYWWGQLGLAYNSSPVAVQANRSYSKIATGLIHYMGILGSTGQVWTWGAGTSGQLGDNTTGGTFGLRVSPWSVRGGRSYSKIAAGAYHGLAIEASTGLAWAWGLGSALGSGNLNNTSSPISVVGGISYRDIAGGSYFSAAIEGSTGYVWTWGQNSYGMLGDNTTIGKSVPVSIVGGRSYNKVICGDFHCIAIEASTGKAWGWGRNTAGEVDADIANRSSPVSVHYVA